MVVELRRWLTAFGERDGAAQDGRIRAWLLKLLCGVAGDRSADDVRLKVDAFVFALADKPAFCFDDVTLRRAMRRFTFWPSAAELMEFAEKIEAAMRERARRAETCVAIGVRRPGRAAEPNWTPAPAPERSPEELRAVGEIMATIRANLAHGPEPVKRKAGA